MLKITHWTPDTCDCTIAYYWDDSVSAEERVHTYCSPLTATQIRPDAWVANVSGQVSNTREGRPFSERICDIHSGIDPATVYNILVAENQLKNLSIDKIVTKNPTLTPEKIEWSFSGKGATRVLSIMASKAGISQTDIDDLNRLPISASYNNTNPKKSLSAEKISVRVIFK